MSNLEQTIARWNAASTLPKWRLQDDLHVEIDGVVVGLIACKDANNSLDVYVDLAQHIEPSACRGLLELNVCPGASDHGCFGLHPLTGRLVYRARLNIEEGLEAFDLVERLSEFTQTAQSRLKQFTH